MLLSQAVSLRSAHRLPLAAVQLFAAQRDASGVRGLAVAPRFAKMLGMPLLDGIRVIRSQIHGYGGVTTRPFPRGATVVHGDGVVYTDDVEFDDTYALVLPADESGTGEAMFFDLVCQTRWFNHSCEPNTVVELEWDAASQTMTAWWVALRDLEVGEEITYDYAMSDGSPYDEFSCSCGSKHCRGHVSGDDWRRSDLWRRYSGYFSPYLQRRILAAEALRSLGARRRRGVRRAGLGPVVVPAE